MKNKVLKLSKFSCLCIHFFFICWILLLRIYFIFGSVSIVHSSMLISHTLSIILLCLFYCCCGSMIPSFCVLILFSWYLLLFFFAVVCRQMNTHKKNERDNFHLCRLSFWLLLTSHHCKRIRPINITFLLNSVLNICRIYVQQLLYQIPCILFDFAEWMRVWHISHHTTKNVLISFSET